MSVKARAEIAANEQLAARAAQGPADSSSPTPTTPAMTPAPQYTQPTTVIPLTTTFIPPPTCTENRLTQQPPPGYFIWNNEPVPPGNRTSSACYPSEFLQAYQSVPSGAAGSSIVPAMSPLVCPANFCTQIVGANNYVACCPKGYQLHLPLTTIDSARPGYGGTCYRDFIHFSTYTVTAYNITGATNVALWIASRSGDQAYAHPIDGFAPTSATVGCPVATPLSNNTIAAPSVSSSSASSASPILPTSSSRNGPSRATIAGVSVGAISVLAVLITVVWALLRWVRARRNSPSSPLQILHLQHDLARAKAHGEVHEKESSGPVEIGGNSSTRMSWKMSRSGRSGPFEMSGDEVPELEAAGDGKIRSESPSAKRRYLNG